MPRVQISKKVKGNSGKGCVTINDGLSISTAVYFYFSFTTYESGFRVSYDERFSYHQELFYNEDKMIEYFEQQWLHITRSQSSQSEIRPQPSQPQNNQNKSDSNPICYLLYFILIFPFMFILILIAGVLDGLLFLLSLGLCLGKCKDKKRTWCSYALVRSATNWSSQRVTQICEFLSGCQCCCVMALFTLPLGFTFVIIGFLFDLVAWLSTFFFCWGYCCKNNSFWRYSLGRLAWRNLKWCCYQLLKCQKII